MDLALPFDPARADWPLLANTNSPATYKLNVTAPYNGDLIGQVEAAEDIHVDEALLSAYALFRAKDRWLALHRRISILRKAGRLIEQHADLLAVETAREGGKPLRDSRVEVARVLECLELACEHIARHNGSRVPMGASERTAHRLAVTQVEPIGVVVAVSAFNHPLNLIAHQVFAAVAAGAPVIVKPAEDTPLACLRLTHILHEAGLPLGWCQCLVTRTNAVANRLVTDQRVALLSFIGSAKVGWMLRSQLPPGTRCALEHGGLAPVVMAPDADQNAACTALTAGGFYHAGQVCVSVQRVFAPRAWAREFGERLARSAQALKVGDPTLEETDVGPLIRPAEVDRVQEWVRQAIRGGAELLCGGDVIVSADDVSGVARCYAPTVLFDPPGDARVSQQEIFGPVVAIYPYDDLEDACHQANGVAFAFQAAVFTDSLDTALRVFKWIDASAVMMNDHTAFRADGMPFAGLRRSGLGVGGIPHSIDEMQIEKMLVIKSPQL